MGNSDNESWLDPRKVPLFVIPHPFIHSSAGYERAGPTLVWANDRGLWVSESIFGIMEENAGFDKVLGSPISCGLARPQLMGDPRD